MTTVLVLSEVGEEVPPFVLELVQLPRIKHREQKNDMIAVRFTVMVFMTANVLKIWLSPKR